MDSQWWERRDWSWTSSDTWSRCKCQRTEWRTWGWCLGQIHRTSPPAPLCTSSTHSWWETTMWRWLAAQQKQREKQPGNTTNTFSKCRVFRWLITQIFIVLVWRTIKTDLLLTQNTTAFCLLSYQPTLLGFLLRCKINWWNMYSTHVVNGI